MLSDVEQHEYGVAAQACRRSAPCTLSFGTLAVAVFCGVVLILAGCATPGEQPSPPLERSAVAAGLDIHQTTTAAPSQWWCQFGDGRLDALIDQALSGNPSLGVAVARIERAQAMVAAIRGAELPNTSLDALANRQRLTEHGLYPPPYAGSVLNTGNVQLGLSWSVDFFGRQRADLAAALGTERAARADAEVAAQQLAAQVVHSYLSLARLGSQREVAQRTLAQREQMLDLVQQRVRAGLDTVVELRQGEGAIPDARVQIELLDEQIELVRHQLAALASQPLKVTAQLIPTLADLHTTPQPAVLGADLLARRPEIAAARARVEAAIEQVQSQRTRFYPDINLSAFAGFNAIGLDNLFDFGSRNWSVGPALHLPLFEGGQLRAQLKGKAADRDAAIYAYNQQIIDVVREAADAASSTAAVVRQQAEQAQALASAQSSYQVAQQRYGQGLGNALIVLNAETQWLAQRRQDVDLQYRALDLQAQLMKSLGGGWTATDPISLSTLPSAHAS